MRYCPTCNERYDEEIIQFCTKDGTPLVEEEQPSFTALPSENVEAPEDDFGEETVIRRKPEDMSGVRDEQSARIVIPTAPEPEQQVRPRTIPAYSPPPPQSNTGKTVALTILGTLAVLGFGAGLFWFLQKEPAANTNVNINPPNQNTNINTNLGFDSNFNFNANANYNTNYNVNTNLNSVVKTPTPTPRPSPTATPPPTPTVTPTPSPSPKPANVRPPANIRPAVNIKPTPLGTPRTGPRPPPLTTNRNSN